MRDEHDASQETSCDFLVDEKREHLNEKVYTDSPANCVLNRELLLEGVRDSKRLYQAFLAALKDLHFQIISNY